MNRVDSLRVAIAVREGADSTSAGVGVNQRPALIPGIQAIRALAVMLVLYAHCQWIGGGYSLLSNPKVLSLLNFGYAGVDIFFVVSGFIIIHITKSDRNCFSFKGYMARRAIRIFPFYFIFSAVWGAMLLVAWGVDRFFLEFGFVDLMTSILAMPRQDNPLLGVGWSLEHELVFYVLFGLLMMAIRRERIPLVFVGIFLLGVVWHGFIPSLKGWVIWDYHLISLFQVQFAFGMIASLKKDALANVDWRASLLLGLVIFAVTVMVLADYQNTSGNLHSNVFPIGLFGVLRVVGFGAAGFCFIASALAIGRYHKVSLRRPSSTMLFILLIGDSSFAIYLSHPIVFELLDQLLSIGGLDSNYSVVLTMRIVGVGLAIMAGIIWYKNVEAPLLMRFHRFVKAAI